MMALWRYLKEMEYDLQQSTLSPCMASTCLSSLYFNLLYISHGSQPSFSQFWGRIPMEQPGETQVRNKEVSAAAAGEMGKEIKKMKVMVAVDESEGSLYALSWFLDHLFLTEDGEVDQIFLIHVQQPFQPYVYPSGPSVFATTAVIDSVRKAQQQNSEALVARAVQICRNKLKEIKVQTVITDGEPKDVICQAIEQMNIDLAVVGSRGLIMRFAGRFWVV